MMKTPFAWLAERYQASDNAVRYCTMAALVMSVLIVVTGGIVRLTASGLGCPTWPECDNGSITPTAAMGVHGIIEFTNRMITYVLCVAVGAAIIACRLRRPWRRSLTRLAWAQFWIVVAEAVLGGISVLVKLNPYVVAAHFLLAMVLIVVAVLTWHRAQEGDGAAVPLVALGVRQLAWALVAATAALIVVGSMVTGAGPHPGDASGIWRIPVNWEKIAQFHADFVYLVLGLTVALILVLRTGSAPDAAKRRAWETLGVLLAQGVIGYVQYFTHLPEGVVGAHMLGACLVWIAVLRVPLALRERASLGLSPQRELERSALA